MKKNILKIFVYPIAFLLALCYHIVTGNKNPNEERKVTTMKKIAALILTIALILSACSALASSDFFTRSAVVVAWEVSGADEWLITCVTPDGEEWAFYADAHEYRIGSVVLLTIWAPEAEIVGVDDCGFLSPAVMADFLP